ANLRAAHTSGKSAFGLDMEKGIAADMVELGILESFHLKRQVVIRAAKAAEMVLCLEEQEHLSEERKFLGSSFQYWADQSEVRDHLISLMIEELEDISAHKIVQCITLLNNMIGIY
ncbi:unnamed protein product, partial [Rotaria sp. Silwood2]